MISELWSSVTCVHVALLLTPNPHSGKDIVNYKDMEGKTENTAGKGPIPKAFSLNFPEVYVYPKWKPFLHPHACVRSYSSMFVLSEILLTLCSSSMIDTLRSIVKVAICTYQTMTYNRFKRL